MAGPVKGNIGDDEIVLNDAATETTLIELVKAVESLSKNSDKEDNAKKVKELGNKSEKTGNQVEDLGDAAEETSGVLGMFGTGLANTGRAMRGLAEEFLVGGSRLSDFSSHVTGLINEFPLLGGLVAGPLQLFVSIIDKNIDTFRELTNVGTDFGGSLFNAQLQAANAGLTLDTFSNTITNNSEAFALMAGSATEGARAFTRISGQIQREFGPRFSALGMTMEETAQFTADYLDQQTRIGRAQFMSERQRAVGAAEFILQLDELSRLTGKRRDQIAAELKEAADDQRVKNLFAVMTDGQREQVQGTLALLKGASPELQNIVTELIGTVGIPISDNAKALTVINPKLADMAAGLADGTVTQEQYAAEIRRTAREVSGSSRAQAEYRSQLIALGVPIATVETMLIGLENVGKNAVDVLTEQQKAAQRGNQGLLDFERRITEARNVILGTLIESGIFQQFETMLSDVVDFMTKDDGLQMLKDGVQVVADFFKDLVQDIKDFGLVDTLKMYIGDAFSGLGDMIKKFIFGGDPVDVKKDLAQTETKIERYQEQYQSLKQDQNRSNITADEYARIQQEIDKTVEKMNALRDKRNELARADREGGAVSNGLLGGLFDSLNMEKIKEFVALLGEGGAIILGFTAFAAILGMFAAGPAAVGAAVIGGLLGLTGAGLYAIGEGIDHIGAGLEKVGKALEVVANIQGADNLEKIVTGLGGLGPALATFAASSGLKDFLEYIGASNPFEKLIDGVNTFSTANTQAVSNIRDIGNGLSSLSNVTNELDTTPITKYTEAMKELVEVLDKLNDELGQDNNGVLTPGTGVNAGTIMQQMSGNSNNNDKLDQLNSTMMMVLQTLQTMNQTGRRQLRATEGMGNVVQ